MLLIWFSLLESVENPVYLSSRGDLSQPGDKINRLIFNLICQAVIKIKTKQVSQSKD